MASKIVIRLFIIFLATVVGVIDALIFWGVCYLLHIDVPKVVLLAVGYVIGCGVQFTSIEDAKAEGLL